jgi:alkylation response protein AidB-like acyl-CoA dehydrogenase|tara:strand:+ start:2655 stop:3398 length:744 start_codon:yes stop_codon:yes gene_type:complete
VDEERWFGIWQRDSMSALSPFQMAWRGGGRADRLAWVFLSGYQAAIRAALPALPASGWAGILVTEKDDPVSLRKNGTSLSGTKTWVAAARHVEHLVVKAGRGEGACYLLVDATREGVSIAPGDRPHFLPELSQGVARFSKVRIDSTDVVSDLSDYGAYEALYVTLACIGFCCARLGSECSEAAALEACSDPAAPDALHALIAADNALSAFAAQMDEALTGGDLSRWQRDRRLVSMFSAAIRARTSTQ